MKKSLVGIALALISLFGSVSQSAVCAAENDTAAVRAATQEFYAALNALFTGEVGPMSNVWSHREDVNYMGPAGGVCVGWKDVLATWETQAALKLGGRVEAVDLHITVGRDLAVVSNYEIGENVCDGKLQSVSIRATTLFRNEGGNWKVIGHHTDLLPFLQK